MDRWSFFFRRAPAPASEPASLKSPSRSSSKPHATLPNLLLESVQGDQLSLARRLAELELALEVLVNKKNPAATPLLDMLASLAAQHLAALSSETALPGTFEEEIEALRAVVDLQLSRSLQEEEKADFKLTVNVLYPVSDSELEEICLKNINPKRELGFLREKVAEAMGCESNRVYLRFAGEILGQDKDDLELKTILKKEHGDFLMNAFRKSQAKFLGFEEDVSEDSQENQGFIIRVNVPSAGDVEEYVIENLDMGTDLGEIRESIAELVGTDSKFLILKHQGKFLRPSEDYMRLHEIFRLADGSGVLKEAQLTAYTKQVAIELGQVDDYFAELIAKPQTGGKEPPVGGVAIPFLQKIQSRSSLLLELHNDEERAAVERFIKEQREKKSKKVPDVTEDKSEHRLEIPSLKKELSAGQALETNIRPSEASIPEVPSVPVPPPPPPPSIAPIAPPPPPPTAPMAPPSIAPPPPTTAIRAPEAPAALSKPIESRCKMLHWDKINLKGSQPSLWSQISLGSIHVDVTRLEKFFSKKSNVVVKKVTKKEKESESKHEEPTIVRLKDQKSSQNLEIMLRKLPVIDRLRDCIFNLDSSTLTLDMIELMFQNIPKDEDVDFVKSLAVTEDAQLERPVQYIQCLLSIPRWQDRLLCWKGSLDFEARLNSVKTIGTEYRNALGAVMEMEALRYTCAIILACGNEMNRGTYRGSAQAFRIDTLLKLRNMKSTSAREGNLLDFVIHQCKELHPESLSTGVELLEIADKSKRLTLEAVISGINDLVQSSQRMLQICSGLDSEISDSDPFREVIEYYSKIVSPQLSGLQSFAEDVTVVSTQFIHYFGLSLSDAEKMFLELYPPEVAEQRRKATLEAADKTEWNPTDIKLISESLEHAFLARRNHRLSKDEAGKAERIKATGEARKKLGEWVKAFELDTEIVQKGVDTKNEHQALSEAVSNMFRLLSDFALQFRDAVHRIIVPVKGRGRHQRSNSGPSFEENEMFSSSFKSKYASAVITDGEIFLSPGRRAVEPDDPELVKGLLEKLDQLRRSTEPLSSPSSSISVSSPSNA